MNFDPAPWRNVEMSEPKKPSPPLLTPTPTPIVPPRHPRNSTSIGIVVFAAAILVGAILVLAFGSPL